MESRQLKDKRASYVLSLPLVCGHFLDVFMFISTVMTWLIYDHFSARLRLPPESLLLTSRSLNLCFEHTQLLPFSMNISQDQSTINGDRRMHPIYWFDDGSLILRLGPKDPYYKVHKSLLALQSPTLLDWIHEDPTNTSHLDSALMKELTSGNCALAPVPSSVSIRIEDLDALFAHIYHTG